jgi:hypothetical protein
MFILRSIPYIAVSEKQGTFSFCLSCSTVHTSTPCTEDSKMKVRTCFIVLLIISASLLFGSYSPSQIPLDSPIYQEIDLLYRLHGIPLPSASRPWNTNEAVQILNMLPQQSPYQELKEQAWQRIQTNQTEGFSSKVTPTLALEAYTHTNSTDFKTFDDWIYSYDERQPLVDLTVSLQFSKSFLLETSLQAGVGGYTAKYKDIEKNLETYGIGAILNQGSATLVTSAYLYRRIFNTNIPTADKTLEPDFPRHSQLTYAGPWYAISLGRGPLSWGQGVSGNLVIGSHISNHTSLSASFFSQNTKVQLLYLFFPDLSTSNAGSRVFLGHRIEFRPLGWARFSISENIMANADNLSPQYLDPTYIYHNIYNPDQVNSIASIEADIALAKGLSLHGQFALDQYQLSSEGAEMANAMAYLGGLTYAWSQDKGYWTALAEVVSVDPAMYRREKVDFLVARDLMKHDDGDPVIIDYLGYSYGSDSQVLQTKLSYYRPNLFSAEGSVTIHRQGELTYDKPHHKNPDTNTDSPNVNGPSPSGDNITERLIVGLAGTCYTDWKNLVLYAQANWIGRRIYQRPTKTYAAEASDLQLVMGMKIRF